MAQLTINIPDAQVPRLTAAFAKRAGVDQADMTAQLARDVILDLIKKIVRQYERQQAEQAVTLPSDIDAT
jgi:hypothetical protein